MQKRVLSVMKVALETVGKVSSYLILIMTLIIVCEVLVRYVFDSPTVWVHETSNLLFLVYIALGGAWVLVEGGHVNVDILYRRLSPRGKAIVSLFGSVVTFIFCGVLLWWGWKWFWFAFQIDQHSGTVFNPPIWPVKIVIPLAALLLLLVRIRFFARDLAFIILKKG